MADSKSDTMDQLSTFLQCGIYRFTEAPVVFMDPVRVINTSYSRVRVSASAYYSRFFNSNLSGHHETELSSTSRKRKRKERKPSHALNERERAADLRHQQMRPLLMKAHECLVGASDLLAVLRSLSCDSLLTVERRESTVAGNEPSFLELGKVWQAPLYEITLKVPDEDGEQSENGCNADQPCSRRMVPVFNNVVINEAGIEVEAEFMSRKYVIPRESCFYMSDLGQIRSLIPADTSSGFNLILIDPPWENASAHQKLMYPTLPSRYFLSLPIKQLVHSDGALVALWVTNRERLRRFVEEELFPSWGVTYAATIFWLKVKPDGSLTSDLDLFHHRPYECLLLGYCDGKGGGSELLQKMGPIEDKIVISIPGDYSRKLPVGELVQKHVPSSGTPRCIELFAREMMAGWTSWGNEPLRFQDSRYFL
ncbi:Methyltransferase-like protein 2 [Linum grandiflorum]